jgi:hypothetical protein
MSSSLPALYDRAFQFAEQAVKTDKYNPLASLPQYSAAIRAFQDVSRAETDISKRRLVGNKVKEFMARMKAIQTAGSPATGDGGCSCGGGSASPAAPFYCSPTFQGGRPGYIFKNDSLGVGYYVDKSSTGRGNAPAAVSPAGTAAPTSNFDSLFPSAPTDKPELAADYTLNTPEEQARQTLEEAVKLDTQGGQLAAAYSLYKEAASQYFGVMSAKKDLVKSTGDPVGIHQRAVVRS